MTFTRLPTEREYWSRFCEVREAQISKLDAIAVAFTSPSRFEELLQIGVTRSAESAAELSRLSDEEWNQFSGFVTDFSNDWQSYFVASLYPAYFHEHQHRGTTHHFKRTTK
jgi:hypothetical protein